MLQNFARTATYSDKEKKINQLLLAQQQIENLLKISENLECAKYIQKHLYPVKYELERQFNLLDKTSQIN